MLDRHHGSLWVLLSYSQDKDSTFSLATEGRR